MLFFSILEMPTLWASKKSMAHPLSSSLDSPAQALCRLTCVTACPPKKHPTQTDTTGLFLVSTNACKI